MRKFDALEKRKAESDKKSSLRQRISPLKDYILGQKYLNTPTAKYIDGKILTDVQMLLGSLSYEELVEKLVSIEKIR